MWSREGRKPSDIKPLLCSGHCADFFPHRLQHDTVPWEVNAAMTPSLQKKGPQVMQLAQAGPRVQGSLWNPC